MSDFIVRKALCDWYDSQTRLTQFTKLMKEAFTVFEYKSGGSCKLSDITGVVENSWTQFTNVDYFGFCGFDSSDYRTVLNASIRVSNAIITRKDFDNILARYRKHIEEYHSKLTAEVEEKHQHIVELYDNSHELTESKFAFIFTNEEIKENFIQFMGNCILTETIHDYHDSQTRLTQFTKLMKEAFTVFEYKSAGSCKLSDITGVVKGSWIQFTNVDYFGFCGFDSSDYRNVLNASIRVSNALITREDFNNILAPYRKRIEEYHSELTAEVEEKRKRITELYDNSDELTKSNFAFIFANEEIKKNFLQFLLS